ncbi:SpoIIE family protein phosphatase [Megalodesulfovibrio gigas]|uniref:Putative regulator n=1 Tax=Megalodesulfovibrio gigas (strain ATCC 19364 / DSM 1382 / NCIMB 9332 / VKM B-1759) TaxID=1121448 RepID=T2GEF5_MEGG1|nr:SpoIIE family protein phosphatase [Megalodesulfovibrio gigas]AGW14648.1 putative regulator [Megalodesulfovibrio gigas DSM 1382 = ATCC 19364]
MFSSIGAKIFALVALILALVAGGVIVLVEQDVSEAMLAAEDRSMDNVLNLVELTIAGRYNGLVRDKVAATNAYKERLTTLTSVIVAGLRQFQKLETPDAQKAAMAWIAELHQGNDSYVVIIDAQDRILIHPDKTLEGQPQDALRDIKGRLLLRAMREETRRYGQAFATWRWPSRTGGEDSRRFGLFVPFDAWGWLICITVDVGLAEDAMERRLAETVETLREHMPRIRFAQSGFVFMFDGAGKIVVPPRNQTADFAAAVNLQTGRPLLEDLQAHARGDRHERVQFAVQQPDGPGPLMQADVSWFKALDWHIAVCAPLAEIHAPSRALIRQISLVVLGIFVVSVLLTRAIIRRVARPLRDLAGYAAALPEQDLTVPREGEFPLAALAAKKGFSRDEVAHLAAAFVSMEGSLRQRVQELMQLTASKERIESELGIAREIQLGLLPKIFPPFPNREELDLNALLVSAREVGGDLYDFALLDERRLFFSIGDVSGKGVPAALFMAIAKTLVKGAAERRSDPARMMAQVNAQLSQDNPNCMFVTLVIGILDLQTGEIQLANAGHNPPVIMDAQGVRYLPWQGSPVAGFMEDVVYTGFSVTLAPGDMLLLYTDGVTEAMNNALQLYGEDRLLTTLREAAPESAKAATDAVRDSVTHFADGAEQSDDITMLCLRWKGSTPHSS